MSRPGIEDITGAYLRHGSIRGAARELGYSESTLREWARNDPRIGTIFYARSDDQNAALVASKDAEVRELRRENKKLNEVIGKREDWLREVIEAARLPVTRPTYKPTTRSKDNLPERSIVLPLFDMQYGQEVNPIDTPFGMGGFDDETFEIRLQRYVTKVTDFLLARAGSTDFKELVIVLGGDLVEGDNIFPGQTWQLEKHPIRQVLDLRVHLAAALDALIGLARAELGVEKVCLYAVPGNHGKVGGKRSGATPSDYSWDYLVSELVIDDLREHQLTRAVNDSGGAILFETAGHTFLVVHGEQVKGWGGLPLYGLTKFDAKVIRMSGIIPDYTLLGHHHQPASITNGSGGRLIISGDWVGPNNLSAQIVAGSRPEQSVLIVAPKHGLVESAHIYLDGEDHRYEPINAPTVWGS